MKLVYLGLDAVMTLDETTSYLLIIESPTLLREMITCLQEQLQGEDGRFVLSEKDEILPLPKVAQLILSPFGLEVNERKFLGKLYAELAGLANSAKLYQQTQALENEIIQYMLRLSCESDYHLEFGPGVDMKALLGAADMRFVFRDETLLEKLLHYLVVMQELAGKTLFVLVNILNFFEAEEVRELSKEASCRKLHLIFLEANEPDKELSMKRIIVDKDICIVRCDE